MARPTKPIDPKDLTHRSPSWNATLTHGIRRRLVQKLPDILKTINCYPKSIDTKIALPILIEMTYRYSECEDDIELANNQKARITRSVSEIRQIFNVPNSLSDTDLDDLEIVAAEWHDILNDLVAAYWIGLNTALDHDQTPTVAGIRKNLRSMTKVPDEQLIKAFDDVDGCTQAYIIHHWAGKEPWVGNETYDPDMYRQSIENALAEPFTAQRGRPAGSGKKAAVILGRDLGEIYLRHTGKLPKYGWDAHENKSSGPFHRFVCQALSIVPKQLLIHLHDHTTTYEGTLAAITRGGSDSFKGRPNR